MKKMFALLLCVILLLSLVSAAAFAQETGGDENEGEIIPLNDLEAAGTISGLGANLSDATDLKIYVKDLEGIETPTFRITQPDRTSNPVLTQVASDAEYGVSNTSVYTVNWDSKNSRWVIRIKVFPKFISSPYTVELLDAEGEPLPMKGYLYKGVGSNAVAYSHAYSFLDYVKIMKIYTEINNPSNTRYTQLYDIMSAYGTLMKNW